MSFDTGFVSAAHRFRVAQVLMCCVCGAFAVAACSLKTTDSDGNIPGTNIDPDEIDDMIDDAANNTATA
jgi:hypothetical protein